MGRGCIVNVLEGIVALWGIVSFGWLTITAVAVGGVIVVVGIVFGLVEL